MNLSVGIESNVLQSLEIKETEAGIFYHGGCVSNALFKIVKAYETYTLNDEAQRRMTHE